MKLELLAKLKGPVYKDDIKKTFNLIFDAFVQEFGIDQTRKGIEDSKKLIISELKNPQLTRRFGKSKSIGEAVEKLFGWIEGQGASTEMEQLKGKAYTYMAGCQLLLNP